jgi:hypothetical protein
MKYLLSIILNVAVGEKFRRSKWLSVNIAVGQNGESCVGQKKKNQK